MDSLVNSNKHLRKTHINSLQSLSEEANAIFSNLFYETNITLYHNHTDITKKENYRPISLMITHINILTRY